VTSRAVDYQGMPLVIARRITSRPVAMRYALLALIAVTLGLAMQNGFYGDWHVFEIAARYLVQRHHPVALPGGFLHLYDELPKLQFGPPSFLVMTPFQLLPPTPARLSSVAMVMLVGVGGIASLDRATHYLAKDAAARVRSQLVLGAGTGPLLFALGLTMRWGHVDDALALIILCLAAPWLARAARGRTSTHAWWVVGLLLGTAAATKPWALAFAPLILVLPRRDLARATLALVAAGAAWWAPFLIAAPGTGNSLGAVRLVVDAGSALHALGVAVDWAPAWVRPAQLVLALGLGLLAVRRGRWADVPLIGLAGRFLLEPAVWPYYAAGPIVAAVFADALGGRRVPWRTPAVLLLTVVGRSALPDRAYGYVQLVGWAALVVGLLVGSSRVSDDLAAEDRVDDEVVEPVTASLG
jgi:hypothetical protein